MTSFRSAMIVMTAVLALTVVGVSPSQAQQKSTAVADVQEIFNTLKEKQTIEADLRQQAESLTAEEQQRQTELQQLQSDLEFMVPGTPAYHQKQMDLERKAIDLQAWRQFQNAKLGRERALQIENLYRKMLETIGRVARENGYQIVLYKEQAVNFAGARSEQLSAVISLRKVLWSADDLDITKQVIVRMNNEYENMAR